jgi:hypothetical protein
MYKIFILILALLGIPYLGFCSLVQDGVTIAEAWFRMSNFEICTAVSLWTATFLGIAKIRQGVPLNPALAKSLAFMAYSVNFVCLCLVTMHFAPEMETIFDFVIGIFERIFG